LKSIEFIFSLWSWKIVICYWLYESQILTVSSSPPDAIILSLYENLPYFTQLLWPIKLALNFLSFHIFKHLSSEADNNNSSFYEKQILFIDAVCAFIYLLFAKILKFLQSILFFQYFIYPFFSAVTICEQSFVNFTSFIWLSDEILKLFYFDMNYCTFIWPSLVT